MRAAAYIRRNWNKVEHHLVTTNPENELIVNQMKHDGIYGTHQKKCLKLEIFNKNIERYKSITSLNRLITAFTVQNNLIPDVKDKKPKSCEDEPPWKKRMTKANHYFKKRLVTSKRITKPKTK